MGAVTLHGVLNMPPDLWVDDPLDQMQRHGRYVEASRLIVEQEERIRILEKRLAKLEGEADG